MLHDIPNENIKFLEIYDFHNGLIQPTEIHYPGEINGQTWGHLKKRLPKQELQEQETHHPTSPLASLERPRFVTGGYPITLKIQKGSPAFSPSNKSLGPPSANAMPCMIILPSSSQFQINGVMFPARTANQCLHAEWFHNVLWVNRQLCKFAEASWLSRHHLWQLETGNVPHWRCLQSHVGHLAGMFGPKNETWKRMSSDWRIKRTLIGKLNGEKLVPIITSKYSCTRGRNLLTRSGLKHKTRD